MIMAQPHLIIVRYLLKLNFLPTECIGLDLWNQIFEDVCNWLCPLNSKVLLGVTLR